MQGNPASFAGPSAGNRYRIVKAHTGGGWTWIAWSDDGSSLHGRSNTYAHALQAAKHCADLMSGAAFIGFSEPSLATSDLLRRLATAPSR